MLSVVTDLFFCSFWFAVNLIQWIFHYRYCIFFIIRESVCFFILYLLFFSCSFLSLMLDRVTCTNSSCFKSLPIDSISSHFWVCCCWLIVLLMSHTFLLLGISNSFCLDVEQCEFYVVGCYNYKSVELLFWQILRLHVNEFTAFESCF